MKGFVFVFSLFFLCGCASYVSKNSIYMKAEKARYGLISITNGEVIINREVCIQDGCYAQ